ncbi:MAG: hypothetical protein JSW28_00950, partial [Thermoplasmata archaeon]
MFCVECGREDELYQGLCRDCYLSKHRFITIPKTIDAEICPHCGARRKGKKWSFAGSDNIDDMVKDIIIENVQCLDEVDNFDVQLTLDFEDE